MGIKPLTISKTLPTFLIFFLLIQLVTGIFLFAPKPQEAKADGESWYDSNWLYRKAITVDNTNNGNTLTDYQVEVNLDTSDFDFLKAQMFGQDIVFTDDDGTTLVDHWVQDYSPIKSADIWVKVPSVPASSTKTIYMYYGNSSYTNTTYQTYHISVDSTAHNDYGLSYPVTYEFLLPANSSGLKAYKRYSTGDAWTQLTEKTSDDFFNGIEAVRFDYASNGSYVSVAFGPDTDDIYVKLTDSNDNPISFSYIGASEYYDDRDAAVSVTGDDWHPTLTPDHNNFDTTCDVMRDASLWFSPGIYTLNIQDPSYWVYIQSQLDAGYVDPCSHSRTHPLSIPYDDYDSEIGGSQSDIINNLDLPALNKKGSQEYMSCWLAPGGLAEYNDARTTLRNYKYLLNRGGVNATRDDVFTKWDDTYGLYKVTGYSYLLDNGNLTDANAKFDSVTTAGGIYLMHMHPANVDWTDGSWERQHIDYVKEKKNLWYVGYGHLYVYHYVQDRVAVSGFSHSGDFDDTFTKDYGESGLVGLWHMDESSGSTTADSSGKNNTGTLTNGATWQGADGGHWDGESDLLFGSGDSLNFDGTNDYINVPDNSTLEGMSQVTVSFWLKFDDDTLNTSILTKGTAYYGAYSVRKWSTDIAPLRWAINSVAGNPYQALTPFKNFETNIWYFFTGTYDGQTLIAYLNGLPGTPVSYEGGVIENNSASLKIGGVSVNEYTPLDGSIDEVRIYNRALSQAEITALHERRRYTSPEPALTVGSEDGYPIAPTIGTPNILSSSVIRWNFTDNSSYETGFKLYNSDGTLIKTVATPNLSYIDETGISASTIYTRYIKAYNSYGESSASSDATQSLGSPAVIINTLPSANQQQIQTNQHQANISTVTFDKPISQMTREEILAKIAEIAQAINQIKSLMPNNQSSVNLFSSIPTTFIFENSLKKGITDIAVKYLQIILNKDKDTRLADTGVGSPGNETTYFGSLTKKAVIKFQEKYKDSVLSPWNLTNGTGFVGQTTRDKLNELHNK